MKSAYMKSVGDVVVRDAALRAPGDDEIRLRVDACGICGSEVGRALAGGREHEPFGHEVGGLL